MKRAIALALIVALMAACSSNELAEQGDRSRAGKDKQRGASGGQGGKKGAKDGSGKGAGSKDAQGAPEEVAAPGEEGNSGESAPQDFGGPDAPSSGIDPSLARASAREEDPSTDAKTQGVTPRYAEVSGASVQGLGKNVRFTITFAGPVPSRVQKDQYMVLAFGITGRNEDDGYALGAVNNDKGWEPYAGAKGENEEFPGSFEISGNTVIFEMPWTHMNGPRAFEWYASSGWYGKVANQTHWSFDAVPNEQAGRFPG